MLSTTKPSIAQSSVRESVKQHSASAEKWTQVRLSKPLFPGLLLLTRTYAVWDLKPEEKGSAINWVELKTSAEIRGPNDMEKFNRKLMKFWIQSFLLGVPKIIVGFRTGDGILVDINEIETHNIPQTVNSRHNPSWNADMCVNFAGVFLECKYLLRTIEVTTLIAGRVKKHYQR